MLAARTATGAYVAAESHVTLAGAAPAGAVRGVISCHGSGVLGPAWAMTDPNVAALNQLLASQGFPVICPDLGGGNTWGNDTSVTRVGQAWTQVVAEGAKADKVLLLGGSMGTLTALNYAKANPTNVAAIALVLPIVDLQDAHDNRGFTAVSETAYGGNAAYLTALAAHNPAVNTASFAGIPIKLWYSTDDPYAFPATVTAFDTAIASATSQTIGANAHTTAGLDPYQVLDFLRPYSS